MEELSEEERKALRGSKFAPLPSLPPPSQPRLAHPGGAIKTNKAAALAKFLERKLQDPQGLASINPDLVELAVRKAKDSVTSGSGGASSSARTVRHVDSFEDPQDSSDDEVDEDAELKNHENGKKVKKDKEKKKNKKKKKDEKKKKKKKKNKKREVEDGKVAGFKKPKKKLKL